MTHTMRKDIFNKFLADFVGLQLPAAAYHGRPVSESDGLLEPITQRKSRFKRNCPLNVRGQANRRKIEAS